MTPLRKNQPTLVLLKPWPRVWAKRPRREAATRRRPTLARMEPLARTLWLA